MKSLFSKRILSIPFVLVFTALLAITVMAETYTATTMRLLHYEGSVEIVDSSGKSSLVMENIRFNSGDSLQTGAASSASVGMDSTKIVTLDENTKVEFTKESNAMKLALSAGSFFLDVSEKLKDNESLDIKTSTMTVGIRGTIVLVSTIPIEEYQNRLSLRTEGGQAPSSQASGDQAGTGSISLSSLEEKIMQASANGGVVSMIGVLEGNVQMDYQDETGNNVKLDISSGQKATLLDSNENGMVDVKPEVKEVTAEDIFGAANKQIQSDPVIQGRMQKAGVNIPTSGNTGDASSYPANGDWTVTSPVTVVAQSASKMFDGSPLTRSTDVLVQGLPKGFTCRATAGGSRTDAGSGDNPIASCVIYNQQSENVTSHFTNIQKVSGKLTIDPAPLTAWSGSATKVYDGTPLTSTETKLTFSPGYEKISYARKNLSYVITEKASVLRRGFAAGSSTDSASGNNASSTTTQQQQSTQSSQQSDQTQSSSLNESQTLYGICGTVLVHGSNPLTEEIKEINLSAGQRLTVFLSDKNQAESIEYVIETITEEEVPEDILRIYADNPEVLTQACTETGWNVEKLNERIKLLQPLVTQNSDVNGVKVNAQTTDNLMEDCTNVRITIDTEGTNYNNRALNKEEAHYTPMKADPSIKIVPNASITDVGTVNNTFTIDWGSAHKDNYKLTEQYGTLTVTPAPATVTTGSAEKEYDGTPLTNSEASISGLVHGETAAVTATGSITNVGSKSNAYSIDWGSTKEKNYNVSSNTGTLKITASKAEVSIKISVAGKTYDGKPLDIDTVVTSDDSGNSVEAASVQSQSITAKASSTDTQDGISNTVSVEGLPSGFTLKAHITGSRTDAGTSELEIESYQIFDEDGKDVTDHFSNVEIVESTLTIAPAPATVSTGSASKEYDGKALTNSEASISGLVDADKDAVKVNSTGSITDVGTTENTYSIDWGEAKSSNYALTENIGTLEVTENSSEITFTAPSGSKTYDGTALKAAAAGDVSAAGLPEGFTFTASASGSQTDAGSSETTVASYKILNADKEDVTANFTNIKSEKGTLTVNPAAAAVTTGSASKEYDSKPLTSSEASITGLTDTDKEVVSVTATGTITDVGTTDNTYAIDWGTAKEGNYTLTENIGTLEVTQNTTEITFKAPSGSKTYDGTALQAGTAGAVTVDGLPEGFTFTASASGSQTDAGSSETTVASYKILNADEKDVTASFANIKTEKGTLTVNPAAAAVTTGSASKEYDGKVLTSSEASITGLADSDKEKVTVSATGSITDVGTTENTYTIDWGTAKEGNYTLTENIGTLEVTQNTTEITFKAPSGSKAYDGTALQADAAGAVTVTGLPEGFTFTSSASGSQTDAGSSEATVASYKILNGDGTDVTASFANIKTEKGTLTITPAAATITTGSASKAYDGKELTNSEASITGLADADKAAVTVTATGTITNVGSAENTYSIDWGTAKEGNYTVSESKGTLEVTANNTEITLKSASSSKTYDGTALKNESVTVEGELPADHSFTFEVTGSQTDVGSSANTISSYKILNADEEDVTEYFTNIKTENGTLTVSTAAVTITTDSKSKEYDGTALTGTASITGLADADKDKVTVTAAGSITDVGSIANSYSIDWGTAKSSNYTLSENIGTLEITKNNTEITFTSASAEKVYDGTPLIVTDVTVEGLPEGFTYICSGGGPVDVGADAGTYENYFNDMEYSYTDENGVEWVGWRYAVIKNADGEDVTDYFSNIKFVRGTLTIKPLDLVFELNSYDTVFSGEKVLPDGMKGTYGNGGEVQEDYTNFETDAFGLPVHLTCGFKLLGDDQVKIDVDGYSDAGDHTYNPVKKFTSGKEGNYNITFDKKQFTIDPLTVNLTVKDGSGVYDGNYHGAELTGASCGDDSATITSTSDTEWDIYGYTLFPSETITVKIEGGGTKAGEYPLTYSYAFGNNDPGNYNITTPSIDKIVVEALEITINMNNPVFDYDGRMHGSGVPELKYENGPQKGESPTPSTMMSNDAGGFKGEYILSDGVTMTAQSSGKGPDAGSYTLSCTQKFSDGADSVNYKVNVTGNTLTINKLTAVVTTGSATGPSGTMYPVTSDEASITGLAVADVEYVTITANGEQWSVGSSDNTYIIEWGTDDHPVNKDNYIIDEHLGTLTMFNAVILPPEGSVVPSKNRKTENPASPADSGSAAEKDTAAGNNEKDEAGNNDESRPTDQSSDESSKADQAVDQPDKSTEGKTSEDKTSEDKSPEDKSSEDKSSEDKGGRDSKETQPNEASERDENTDSKADKNGQTSDSKDSKDSIDSKGSDENKDSKEKQSDQASEKKVNEVNKDSDSKESRQDQASESKENTAKKADSVNAESTDTKKTEKTDLK